MLQCVAGARGNYTLSLMAQQPESLASFEGKAAASLASHVPEGMDVEQRVRRFWRSLSSTMDPPMYGADARGSLFNDDFASG